ncbi:Polyketide synthase [Actinidia chinensis var. chinensis]|uniref:Polyketide synthase n=1 Tax=Actinidia chinensis var. chinensis TaxID=1590841 RepID=A0A2R6RZ67_ACTCC|nr:Polyketide synthase [Actinidia chinensis var. chinensis]
MFVSFSRFCKAQCKAVIKKKRRANIVINLIHVGNCIRVSVAEVHVCSEEENLTVTSLICFAEEGYARHRTSFFLAGF